MWTRACSEVSSDLWNPNNSIKSSLLKGTLTCLIHDHSSLIFYKIRSTSSLWGWTKLPILVSQRLPYYHVVLYQRDLPLQRWLQGHKRPDFHFLAPPLSASAPSMAIWNSRPQSSHVYRMDGQWGTWVLKETTLGHPHSCSSVLCNYFCNSTYHKYVM